MSPEIERLVKLQEIETQAAEAEKRIADAPVQIAALDAKLTAARDGVAAAKAAIADNQSHRRTLDKDLITAQQRLSKYKEQLMAVKTNDEYRAMQHQIEAVGAEVLQHEERVLVSMMEADEASASIKKAEAALKAAQAKVSAERGAIENDVKSHQASLAELNAARDRIIKALDDKGVIDTFQRIAKVRGTAVARAEGERCTVCQVRLRPAVFAEVRKNEQIVQCDSCNRILYFVAPKVPQAPEAPTAP